MFKRFSTNYMAILLFADIIVIQLSFALATYARMRLPLGQTLDVKLMAIWGYIPSWHLYVTIGVIWLMSFIVQSVYSPRQVVRWIDEFQHVVIAHILAALSLAGVLYFANLDLARLTYVYFCATALVGLLGYRSLLRIWHRLHRDDPNRVAKILVVGAGEIGQSIVGEFQRQQWPGVTFMGFLDCNKELHGQTVLSLPVLGGLEQINRVVREKKIDEVLIALPASEHSSLVNLVTHMHTLPVHIRVIPDYFGLSYFGATVETLGGIPLIGLRDPAIDEFQRLMKRLFDVVASSLGLILTLPLTIGAAIAIKLEDGGPIFYNAERVGENGKLFRMVKFRSMVVNADKIQEQINQVDENGNLIHKRADDPRITRTGRFLRRTSIDELPQLINVFRGEMSLVGPRPELPWVVAQYEPWQRKRLAVPQGMTGWWQVNGRGDNLMHLHTEQDIYYIQNYSLWLDLQILFKTVFAVLRSKGAY
ncbi:MAG: sugar transferase [Caldilineaceae bacterium]